MYGGSGTWPNRSIASSTGSGERSRTTARAAFRHLQNLDVELRRHVNDRARA